MSLSKSSLTLACAISAILLSGCATSTLIKKDSKKTGGVSKSMLVNSVNREIENK